MKLELRPPRVDELPEASSLCVRSKAHWGYDAEFLRLCQEELTLTPEDLRGDLVTLALLDRKIVGVAQVSRSDQVSRSSGRIGQQFELEKLFVDPDCMRNGVGRALFRWAVNACTNQGAAEMLMEADPGAAPFYLAMGCRQAGVAASGSIPGRTLPRFAFDLAPRLSDG